MVRTRSPLENLSKGELIEELIIVDDITSKISYLTNRFDDFLRTFEVISFEVISSSYFITRNCNRLLTERFVQLERNAVTNVQYHRREFKALLLYVNYKIICYINRLIKTFSQNIDILTSIIN